MTTFTNMMLSAAIALLNRIDFDAVLEAVYTVAARRIDGAVLATIDRLVGMVDAMDLPGEEKFAWVMDALTAPNSPLRALVGGTPTRLLRWAIETAVLRLKAN